MASSSSSTHREKRPSGFRGASPGNRVFVFVSTVKVNGERTIPGRPFTALDVPAPGDPYALSKYEAEVGLRELERGGALGVAVVRPVLVYGPGVGANFRAMLGTQPSFSTPLFSETLSFANRTYNGLDPSTTYFFRVRAVNWKRSVSLLGCNRPRPTACCFQ